MPRHRQSIQAAIVLCSMVILLAAPGRVARAAAITIFSSSDILPYSRCIEGAREVFADRPVTVVQMDGSLERGREFLGRLQPAATDLLLAVGPQAAYLLAREQIAAPRLFCMVLNPDKLVGTPPAYGGISLNIPADFQLAQIAAAFPDRRRVGVFYQAEGNQEAIDQLTAAAAAHGRTLVPVPLEAASDIAARLQAPDFAIDVLLIIPDETLRSRRIMEYLIESSLRRSIPVAGYNSWFVRNGAILSFMVDYRAVGRQVAALAVAGAAEARIVSPQRIRVGVNLKIAGKLGVGIDAGFVARADEVIR